MILKDNSTNFLIHRPKSILKKPKTPLTNKTANRSMIITSDLFQLETCKIQKTAVEHIDTFSLDDEVVFSYYFFIKFKGLTVLI